VVPLTLTDKQQEKKQLLLSDLNLKTVVAMQMRETFQQLYTLNSLGEFEQKLGEWCAWLERSDLEPMLKVR